MSFGLGAIVEAENTLNDGFEIGWNGERAGAAAESTGSMLVVTEVRAEGIVEGPDRAAEFYGAAGTVFADDFQVVLFGKFADFFQVGRGCAVGAGEFLASKIFSLARKLGGVPSDFGRGGKFAGFRTAAQQNRHFDLLLGVGGTNVLATGQGGASAAPELNAILRIGHECLHEELSVQGWGIESIAADGVRNGKSDGANSSKNVD
jgi:hypothetical protein